MKNIITTILAIIAPSIILCGCNRLSDEQALLEFKAEHPNATVQKHFVGEGDGDHAYFHFQYLEKGSAEPHESVWLYQKQSNGEWKPINKQTQNQRTNSITGSAGSE